MTAGTSLWAIGLLVAVLLVEMIALQATTAGTSLWAIGLLVAVLFVGMIAPLNPFPTMKVVSMLEIRCLTILLLTVILSIRSPFYREEQSTARVRPVLSNNEGRSNDCDATVSDDPSFGQTMLRVVDANLHPPLPTFSLPLEVVSTREERKRFLDMVVDDPKHEHLFDTNSAFNLGFVFEEGNEEFASKDSTNRLTDLGCLSLN
jgi:hypothetical protein